MGLDSSIWGAPTLHALGENAGEGRLTADCGRWYCSPAFSGTTESSKSLLYRDGAGQRRPPIHRGGSEDFFFIISMLKSAFNFVLSLSSTSTYDSEYASASELLAASLNGRFEHAVMAGETR